MKVLTANSAIDLNPVYSPNGRKIVWTEGSFIEDLWLMRRGGSNQHLLLDTGGRDITPGWQPR